MPYINYDENGNITEIYACQQYEDQIFVIIPNDNKIYKYINNELVEDKLSEFQKDIQYQHDAFDEYSREIIYQINYNTILGNTTLVTSLQEQLQTEQQAVITRINDITEVYNNAST